MVQQSEKKSAKKCNQFKVGDVVSIKIDRVDKTSLFHPNMLLGKITELENRYARVVTKFGRIQTLISPTRLNLCTASNLSFDYTKEVTLSLHQLVNRLISKMHSLKVEKTFPFFSKA